MRKWLRRNRFWLLLPFAIGLIVQYCVTENAWVFYGGMGLVGVTWLLMLFLMPDV